MIEIAEKILGGLREVSVAINYLADVIKSPAADASTSLQILADKFGWSLNALPYLMWALTALFLALAALFAVLAVRILLEVLDWLIAKMARFFNRVLRAVMDRVKRVGHATVDGSMQIASTGIEQGAKVANMGAQLVSRNAPKVQAGIKATGKVLADGSANVGAAMKRGGEVGGQILMQQSKQAADLAKKASGVAANVAKHNAPKVQAGIKATTKKSGQFLREVSIKLRHSVNGMKGKKGVALIELTIVMVVVALLATIAV